MARWRGSAPRRRAAIGRSAATVYVLPVDHALPSRIFAEDLTMKMAPLTPDDLRGVFTVPPLPRRASARRPIDFGENDRLVRHMAAGGLTRFLYGGNAFLYHVTLAEYEELLGWMAGFADDHWAIPSVGPSFGRAMDQAALLRRHRFPCAMALPCSDPRDAAGLEAGLREIANAAGLGLILYLKDEGNFGADKDAGL